MKFDDTIVKQILLRENYLSAKDITDAENYTTTHRSSSFIDYLLEKNLITKDLLGQAIAESYGVPYSDLNSEQPPARQVTLIPEVIAKQYRIIVFSYTNDQLTIATDDPAQERLQALCNEMFPQHTVQITYSLPEDIDACFIHYQQSLAARCSKIIEYNEKVAPRLLDGIFDNALSYFASDIHFEPQINQILIRFRIDGILHEVCRIPVEHYENILNRIKVLSGLRIDEHFVAQDGSLRYVRDKDNAVDLRTSIVPTVEGEKVVLRVLSEYVRGFSLDALGLSSTHQQLLEQAAKKPFGMILMAGPTGSGKTTTLYGLLKLVNNPDVNIMTIEDPVEYKVLGVNQIQVNSQTNLTFAKGLRSITRQDPDIILVGEIRDQETAEIAVNAALTGHLLYSTFHANDAATAIPRLLNMGIEPFLLASTLEVIFAQRLVRKICEHCRHSVKKTTPRVGRYEGKKCEACNYTGYKGRTAIFECIHITPAMKNLILHTPSAEEIWQLARQEGSKTLFEDGMEKVKMGITTHEELLRVAEPPRP